MKITILNGNAGSATFDPYLIDLRARLEDSGHYVTLLNLRELSLKYCTGCFDCWTKTPGLCEKDQASQDMGRAVINSDFTIWASPLKMGFPTALLKMALDKHLPLIHPYMVVDQGEAHHLKRYKSYPRVGMLVENGSDTTEKDLEIITNVFSRTALNFKSKLDFMETTELPPAELVGKIIKPRKGPHLYEKMPMFIPGETIAPPQTITIINGSPRGKKGNTPIMLGEFQKGFGDVSEIHHLVVTREIKKHVKAFQEAECVWLGFPLYADSMPGLVKNFIEALEPFIGQDGNPPIGFLVQSGFPEGIHSRYVETYLAELANRLGSPYLGTIIKGNGEGIRFMPAEYSQDLFKIMQTLGVSLRETGSLDQDLLLDLAKPERYARILGPLFRLFLKTKMSHRYFDNMLLENDSYELRNDRPLINT